MGVALQVGFHALLRAGELFQIQANDVTVKDDFVHLYLGQTKASCRNANVDAVRFRHHQVALLLKTWLSTADKNGFLVPDSSTTFSSWFFTSSERNLFAFSRLEAIFSSPGRSYIHFWWNLILFSGGPTRPLGISTNGSCLYGRFLGSFKRHQV